VSGQEVLGVEAFLCGLCGGWHAQGLAGRCLGEAGLREEGRESGEEWPDPGGWGVRRVGDMILVRRMVESDIAAVARIRVDGWRAAYAGIVPGPYLDAMDAGEGARVMRERFLDAGRTVTDLVAVDAEGAVVGWACFGPGEGGSGEGELYTLYVEPELIGNGVGRALIDVVHREGGFAAVGLWVLEGNVRARRFYEKAGYRADGTTQEDPYEDGTVLTEVRYRRSL
jgi:ribosomal protein S18 acetylase RimI-like enzyme